MTVCPPSLVGKTKVTSPRSIVSPLSILAEEPKGEGSLGIFVEGEATAGVGIELSIHGPGGIASDGIGSVGFGSAGSGNPPKDPGGGSTGGGSRRGEDTGGGETGG